MRVKDYLYQKYLYLLLREKPKLMDKKEQVLHDCKALGVVRLTQSKSVAFNIKTRTQQCPLWPPNQYAQTPF